jgi:hypothetical protein
MIALGIDPDTSDTAFAWWDEQGPMDIVVAHVVRRKGVKRSLMQTAHAIKNASSTSGVSIAAVEGQQQDRRRTGKRDLFTLAQVAGLCIGFVADRYPNAQLLVPRPDEWKGQLPKRVHQARLYEELGWGYEQSDTYAVPVRVPDRFASITRGQWKHAGDALLLARWAYEQAR